MVVRAAKAGDGGGTFAGTAACAFAGAGVCAFAAGADCARAGGCGAFKETGRVAWWEVKEGRVTDPTLDRVRGAA